MNSNYVLYTDDERQIIDEMQQKTNNALFFEEGIEQGANEEKNEMIKNMLSKNISIELISEISNKPVKEIKEMAVALKLI